eukprot:12252551-Alexandrium_andersonii.AAC.1
MGQSDTCRTSPPTRAQPEHEMRSALSGERGVAPRSRHPRSLRRVGAPPRPFPALAVQRKAYRD